MQILLVEDDLRLGKMTKLMIEAHQHLVTWVTDGDDAIDYALTGRYDMMLLDWMLPSKDGIEIIKEVRDKQSHIPIIMMTAKGTLDDKITGISTGADDYIVKPFDFDELNIRMIALQRRTNHQTNIVTVGPLSWDSLKQVILLNGEEMNLTKKEYLLLSLFIQHHEGIIHRDLIIDKVWSIDDEVTDNTVEALIRRLRQKLGDDILPYKIKVIRNMGYRLMKDE